MCHMLEEGALTDITRTESHYVRIFFYGRQIMQDYSRFLYAFYLNIAMF